MESDRFINSVQLRLSKWPRWLLAHNESMNSVWEKPLNLKVFLTSRIGDGKLVTAIQSVLISFPIDRDNFKQEWSAFNLSSHKVTALNVVSL